MKTFFISMLICNYCFTQAINDSGRIYFDKIENKKQISLKIDSIKKAFTEDQQSYLKWIEFNVYYHYPVNGNVSFRWLRMLKSIFNILSKSYKSNYVQYHIVNTPVERNLSEEESYIIIYSSLLRKNLVPDTQ